MRVPLILQVNGESRCILVPPSRTLLRALREDLDLTGTKQGCGRGECGACTVLLDGKPVCSCLVLAAQASGRSILTVEGLALEGSLDPLQRAFIAEGAVQCGFCTPGMLLSARALLAGGAALDEAAIRRGLAGNLCRCTGYARIVRAVRRAVASWGAGGSDLAGASAGVAGDGAVEMVGARRTAGG